MKAARLHAACLWTPDNDEGALDFHNDRPNGMIRRAHSLVQIILNTHSQVTTRKSLMDARHPLATLGHEYNY